MATKNHDVPNGVEFTGIADAGLVTFLGLTPGAHPVIYSIGFQPAAPDWSLELIGHVGKISLKKPGEDAHNFSGRHVVPLNKDGTAYKLVAKTKGKSGHGSLTVTYALERMTD